MKQIIVDTRTGIIERTLPSYIKVVNIETVPIEPAPKENVVYELRYTEEKGLHYIEIPIKKELSQEDKMEMLTERVRLLERISIGSSEVPENIAPDVSIDIKDNITDTGNSTEEPSPQEPPKPQDSNIPSVPDTIPEDINLDELTGSIEPGKNNAGDTAGGDIIDVPDELDENLLKDLENMLP